jgi:hypothetical protein
MNYYSQANQDKWICEETNFKKNGYFIEIGAYDGIQTSNTFFLEKNLNWSGICIEAEPTIFTNLIKNRNCKNIFSAVSNKNGKCFFYGDSICEDGIGNEVPMKTLNSILEENDCPKIIDYISIDIEGHEFSVLEIFDFNKWHINRMTIEHNLYLNGPEQKDKIFNLMSKNGFNRKVEDAPCLDLNPSVFGKPYEDWYVNNIIK